MVGEWRQSINGCKVFDKLTSSVGPAFRRLRSCLTYSTSALFRVLDFVVLYNVAVFCLERPKHTLVSVTRSVLQSVPRNVHSVHKTPPNLEYRLAE